MTSLRLAPDGPGIEPRWTRGTKVAVGTAYSTSSRVWYTLDHGCVTEVYYPTIDSPQIRDLQFLVTDGETFFHDERRHFTGEIDCVSTAALGFDVINREKQGRYSIHKTILGDPHQNSLLVNTRLEAPPDLLPRLKMYVLCAPHLEIGGWHNNGEVMRWDGRTALVAYKGSTWLAIAATVPFTAASCGYVGINDGWTDLSTNYHLDWQYDAAVDGNIALTGELDLSKGASFTLAMAFGTTRHHALSTLAQSLSIPFEHNRDAFIRQWERTSKRFSLPAGSHNSALFERSVNLLLAHEDKTYPGAMIASLSIPWGDEKSDEEIGGYHLVWTRDLVKSVAGLLAVGDLATPLRALIYLAVSQREDGAFYQNFWIDGRAYWTGIQLDEVAFPVILAWRLWKLDALGNFDPYSMVRRACAFLIREGPVTAQDRWEEASGYSPSTLAAHIAALICGAEFLEDRGEKSTAEFVRDYADFLESHIERWTVTTRGTLVPGIQRHYIRINPGVIQHCADEDPNCGTLRLANQPPGNGSEYPANTIVDAGFLELVRFGIRAPDDPVILDSLRVVDAVLKVDTPAGPVWRRYNHDGFGQREDGTSYNGWGVGRAWPMLTAERGIYELTAGHDPEPYIRTLEKFAGGIGLIPEQVWDAPDLPERYLVFGGETGAAMPLVWAHAEYVKLCRSAADGENSESIEPVYDRYVRDHRRRPTIEIWKSNRQIARVSGGTQLRIQAGSPFLLHWTADKWVHHTDTRSTGTSLDIEFVDLSVLEEAGTIRFTFLWLSENRWEGKDYEIEVHSREVLNAGGNGGPRQDGSRDGQTPAPKRSRMHRVRRVTKRSDGIGEGGR